MGALTKDSLQPTQPEEGAKIDKANAPPQSTSHTKALGHTATSSNAYHHHNQIQFVTPHPQLATSGSVVISLQDPGPSQAAPYLQTPEDLGKDFWGDESGIADNKVDAVYPPIFHSILAYTAHCFPEAL